MITVCGTKYIVDHSCLLVESNNSRPQFGLLKNIYIVNSSDVFFEREMPDTSQILWGPTLAQGYNICAQAWPSGSYLLWQNYNQWSIIHTNLVWPGWFDRPAWDGYTYALTWLRWLLSDWWRWGSCSKWIWLSYQYLQLSTAILSAKWAQSAQVAFLNIDYSLGWKAHVCQFCCYNV